MSKRGERPIGFLLPALVFGLGVAAMWIGIPKELAVWRLSNSGGQTVGKVMAIQHQSKKEILSLAYQAGGKTFDIVSEQDDSALPKTAVIYDKDDPSVATADLEGDRKIANEYLIAGAIELIVGGWFTFTAIRQRRTALLNAVAAKRSKGR